MSDKPIAQKLSLKPGNRLLLVNPPAGYAESIGELPPGTQLAEAAQAPVEAMRVVET